MRCLRHQGADGCVSMSQVQPLLRGAGWIRGAPAAVVLHELPVVLSGPRRIVQMVRHHTRAGSPEAAPVDAHHHRWTHRDGVARRSAAARSQGKISRAQHGASSSEVAIEDRAADDSVLQVVASTPTDTFVASHTIASVANVDAPPPAPSPMCRRRCPLSGRAARCVSTCRSAASSIGTPAHRAIPAAFGRYRRAPFEPVAPLAPAGPGVLRSKSRASSPWVNLVAKNWVVVRTGARKDARIVASVGPDSRVQLGETHGTWRRIRSRDIVGWVDLRRASFAEVRSTRTNGLAVR